MARRAKGEGSLYKDKRGYWVGQYRIDGKRKTISGKTQAEVRAKLREINQAIADNELAVSDREANVTEGEWADLWLETYARPSVKITTYESYESYIKKPAAECTGEEILTELLYHLDMLDMKDELLAHSYISTCMMPYITSQFMPRGSGDRPNVLPDGCTNLALIGQFVELPGDVVFTVETSVRTAMMAAYGLLKLDKPVVPIYEGQFDIRILSMVAKKMLGVREITVKDLPPVNPLKLKSTAENLIAMINSIPELERGEIVY